MDAWRLRGQPWSTIVLVGGFFKLHTVWTPEWCFGRGLCVNTRPCGLCRQRLHTLWRDEKLRRGVGAQAALFPLMPHGDPV